MKTVLEIIQRTTDFLARKGIAQPRLEAEILLSAALGMPRLNLYLQFERPLSEGELAPLRDSVRQRGLRIPLQVILGRTGFHEIELLVPPGILVPRPETEELVEWILDDHPADSSQPLRVLDLGCGSGAIGLALKHARPQWDLHLRDLSDEAIAATHANLENLGLDATLSQGSWFEKIEPGFDLIVSNPPYLTDSEWESAGPEVRLHEPRSALVGGGADGSDNLFQIIAEAPRFLRPGGRVYCETGIAQPEAVSKMYPDFGYNNFESRFDLSGRPRMVRLTLPA